MVTIVTKKLIYPSEPEAQKALAPMLAALDGLREQLDEALAAKKMEHAEELLAKIQHLVEDIDAVTCDIPTPGPHN